MLGVVQALALWMTPMLWTTMLLGVAILTVTGLDDPYGRMGVKTFISPSVIPLSKGHPEYCEVLQLFFGCVFARVTKRCATWYDFIISWSRRFTSSRNMPRVVFWLVVSFQMLKVTAYK